MTTFNANDFIDKENSYDGSTDMTRFIILRRTKCFVWVKPVLQVSYGMMNSIHHYDEGEGIVKAKIQKYNDKEDGFRYNCIHYLFISDINIDRITKHKEKYYKNIKEREKEITINKEEKVKINYEEKIKNRKLKLLYIRNDIGCLERQIEEKQEEEKDLEDMIEKFKLQKHQEEEEDIIKVSKVCLCFCSNCKSYHNQSWIGCEDCDKEICWKCNKLTCDDEVSIYDPNYR